MAVVNISVHSMIMWHLIKFFMPLIIVVSVLGAILFLGIIVAVFRTFFCNKKGEDNE